MLTNNYPLLFYVISTHVRGVLIFQLLQRSNFMSKGRDRTISRRTDGTWVNKRNDADKASSLHNTQRDAIDAARNMLKNQGGGELTTKGRDGRIRSKDTIPPGNDPFPPRDTEH